MSEKDGIRLKITESYTLEKFDAQGDLFEKVRLSPDKPPEVIFRREGEPEESYVPQAQPPVEGET